MHHGIMRGGKNETRGVGMYESALVSTWWLPHPPSLLLPIAPESLSFDLSVYSVVKRKVMKKSLSPLIH